MLGSIKYIKLDYHFIREQIANANVKVTYISIADQIVDILTKPLGDHCFEFLCSKLRLLPYPKSAC